MSYKKITDFVKHLFDAQDDIPVAKKLPDGTQVVAIEWPSQPLSPVQTNIPPTVLEALEIEDKYKCDITGYLNQWFQLRARADQEGIRYGNRQELSDWTFDF